MRPTNAPVLGQALKAGAAVEQSTPFAALTFLQKISRVREPVSRLDDTLFYAETLQTGDGLKPRILQLPVQQGEPWVGLPLPPGTRMTGGRVSILAHAPLAVDAAQPLAGLFVDEWMEVVPSATEVTGIAFQFDRPNSAPPQAILLAVSPSREPLWDLPTLEAVVLEALDGARLRLVDANAMKTAGHVLPMLYFAHNLQADTIRLRTGAFDPS
jgi:hypothetical protein